MKHLFLPNRFFSVLGGVILLFVLSFPFPFLFVGAQIVLAVFIALCLVDYLLLFDRRVVVEAERALPKIMSLGEVINVTLILENPTGLRLKVGVVDELPEQFQQRDFWVTVDLAKGEEKKIHYELRPLSRGAYLFGATNLFLTTRLGLLQRRIARKNNCEVPVYPSILQMKQLEWSAFDKTNIKRGIKRVRRLGHSYEFEQIKNYVKGDDFRSINWKASSRRATLMVNQYEDERSQQVYNIIDKSRTMRLPFEGLTLMDHAINTSLVISNIVLRKHDRAGLFTFADKMGSFIKADNHSTQLSRILNALYKEQERKIEANFELLYFGVRKFMRRRSLLLLYTNFESAYALDRVLPILRKINNLHLLVVVFFQNTEVEAFAHQPCETVEEIYQQTVAQQAIAEKEQMVQKLQMYGIQVVLTAPEELAVNTINKYLELKSRGMI